MAQYNFLNLPQIEQQAQAVRAREQAMGRAKVNAQREDQAYARQEQQYSEAEQYQSLARMHAAVRVINEQFAAGKPDLAMAAADEIAPWLAEKGDYDMSAFDPANITPESMQEAETRLSAALQQFKPVGQQKGAGQTADIQNYQYLSALSPQERDLWFRMKRQQPGLSLKEITRSDGSKQFVAWDEETGQGFDINSGSPITTPPGQQPVQTQQQGGPTLGVSPDPAEQAARTERAKLLAKAGVEDEQSFSSDIMAKRFQINQTRGTIEDVDRAIGLSNWWSTGKASQILEAFGATDARSLKAALQPIKASLAFDRLQAMRDASKTGGALGQVSERELGLLQDSLESMDQAQDTASIVAALRRVRQHYANVLQLQIGQEALLAGTQFAATPEDAAKLPPGTTFVNPDGKVLRVPGGQ